MDNQNIPTIVYETEVARHERTEKRLLTTLFIVIVLSIIAVFAIDYGWRCFISEYDIHNYDYDQEGDVNIVGDGNGVDNDGAKSAHQEND